MKKKYIELNEEEYEFLKMYNALPKQEQKLVRIVCAIGASNVLNADEFYLLLQNLMHK